MKLSSKAVVFLIEAVDFQLAHFDGLLADPDLNEDDRSDLQNDRAFLRAVREDLQRDHDETVAALREECL